ncbi:MAG: hypothetical protein QOF76_4639, partial [Solirubrobacteraceae bacterium]|nr:hypothetical protein [Solirubrobacteraceae bacterium]
ESLGNSFGCTTPILGYSIVFDQPIYGFDNEVPVLDSTKSATNELFSCEGGFPSYGMSCFGSYTHPGNQPTGAVGLDRDACVDPRYKAWLTVVINAKGQARGPFPLKGPFGCDSYTSPIKRLMAWIAQLQAAKKAG